MLLLHFVIVLMFMKSIANKRKSLLLQLQSVELNILDAIGFVEGTLGVIQKLRDENKMKNDQIEASVIFAEKPRCVDEHVGTTTVFLLKDYHRKQFRKVLDVLISRMTKHLVQCKKSLLPLLKCLMLYQLMDHAFILLSRYFHTSIT